MASLHDSNPLPLHPRAPRALLERAFEEALDLHRAAAIYCEERVKLTNLEPSPENLDQVVAAEALEFEARARCMGVFSELLDWQAASGVRAGGGVRTVWTDLRDDR